MAEIDLPSGKALGYFKRLIWDDSMKQDRLFAWADKTLYQQTIQAAQHGEFARELGFEFFHKNATDSYKQVQFGEANVQLTFHGNDAPPADLPDCMRLEPDIDYYKDIGAHALLEVIPNTVERWAGQTGLTDPKAVYVLRWIAGRHAGVPELTRPTPSSPHEDRPGAYYEQTSKELAGAKPAAANCCEIPFTPATSRILQSARIAQICPARPEWSPMSALTSS